MAGEDLIQSFFHKTSDAIFILNKEQKIIEKNDAAIVLLKKMNEEYAETFDFCSMCSGDISIESGEACLNCMMKMQPIGESFQISIKEIPYSGSFVILDEEETKVLVLRNLTMQQKTEKLRQQSLLTRYVINAQEEERKRISRELHDGLAQEMFSTLMEVRKLKYVDAGKDFDKQMNLVDDNMSTILNDIRNMAVDLRPSALDDLGLYPAIKSYCKKYEQTFNIPVSLISDIENRRFDPMIEISLYRIMQESLINSAKYSGADEVIVLLRATSRQVILDIFDEGCGFSVDNIQVQGTGLGLLNMQERIDILGGTFEIISECGKGTQVRVHVPIQ